MKIPHTSVAEDVAKFIGKFTDEGENKAVIDKFTKGCCFWFSYILSDRFPLFGEIKYDPVLGHFYTTICGRDYDITGDVTGCYQGIPWDEYYDTSHRKRIVRDCILFEAVEK